MTNEVERRKLTLGIGHVQGHVEMRKHNLDEEYMKQWDIRTRTNSV